MSTMAPVTYWTKTSFNLATLHFLVKNDSDEDQNDEDHDTLDAHSNPSS